MVEKAEKMEIKTSMIKSLLAVGSRGRKKMPINQDALAQVTALANLLAKEALLRSLRSAQNSKSDRVTEQDFKKIVAQLMLDFS